MWFVSLGTGYSHVWSTLPAQLQNWHLPLAHSLSLRQICDEAIVSPVVALGQMGPGWHVTEALDLVRPVERMQQMSPAVGQSAASLQVISVPPVHAVPAVTQDSLVSVSQQKFAGTAHDASPQPTVPGVQGLPPSVGTQASGWSPACEFTSGRFIPASFTPLDEVEPPPVPVLEALLELETLEVPLVLLLE